MPKTYGSDIVPGLTPGKSKIFGNEYAPSQTYNPLKQEEGVSPRSSFGTLDVQRYLPRFLQTSAGNLGQYQTHLGNELMAGMRNLGALFRTPGSISPTLSAAISPMLAMETERIGRTTAGQISEAAGAAGRSGLGSSGMAMALQRAIERAGARDISTAKRGAIAQSEQLRRQDLDQMLNLINMITNASFQGRNITLGHAAQQIEKQGQKQQQQAATYATYASLLGALI